MTDQRLDRVQLDRPGASNQADKPLGCAAEQIKPASRYTAVDDMCVITSYFNPCQYRSLLTNYLIFRDSMVASGIKLVTVECAFGAAPFQLESSEHVIQVRSQSVLWQKERLLNIALERVCKRFAKVAWIDADLFFTSADWAVQASKMLDRYEMVQLFERILQLPKGATACDGTSPSGSGFVSVIAKEPSRLKMSSDRHGRTGGAWCARSSVLSAGIFDGCILGDSDHVMAHAIYKDLTSRCLDFTFYRDQASRNYFEDWAARFIASLHGEIAFLPETILHLWHGKTENRLYRQRSEKLACFGVDPRVDLRLNADSCWEWQTERPHLHNYVANYFKLRQDDDDIVTGSDKLQQ
jgi:hypothetical protein